MKLYKLTGQMKELEALADDPDMELAVADTLEGLNMEIQEKAANIMHIVANSGSDIEAIDREIARLSDRKKRIESFQEDLRDYLRQNMEAMEIKKIKCPLFTINLIAGRDVAVIDDTDKIPDEYVKVKTTVQPIKADILKALKDGAEVAGAHIEKTKSSIRIK